MNAWTGFLLRYTLAAVLGTALIIVLGPRFKPREVGANLKDLGAGVQRSARQAGRQAGRIAEDIRESLPAAAPDAPAGSAGTGTPAVARPAAVSGGAPRAAAEPSGGRWAVVDTPRTAHYTTEGKFLSYLPPGALLTVEDVKRNGDTRLAVCRPADGNPGPRFLVKADHLAIHAGAPDRIAPEARRLVVQIAQLDVEIATRRREQREGIRQDNPHAAAYAEARSAYRAYWSRVKDLQARRDSGTGDARMEALDELRRLTGDDRRITQTYERAKAAYEAWNKANPRPAGDTPEIQRLVAERGRLAAVLEEEETL